jgi:hypothetical protein
MRSWLAAYGVLAVTLILGTFSRVIQLGFPVSGPYEFRQAQTAFAVRGLVQGEGSPLFSYLPVFGQANQVPFEFPIFQIMAAQVSSLGVTEAFSGRFVSFLLFQVSAVLTWVLARHLFGLVVANVSLIIFEFSPFGMVWGAAFLIESTALTFTLGAIITLEVARRRGVGKLLPLAAVLAILAFLVKITTPIGWFAGYLAYLAMVERIAWRPTGLVKKFGPITLTGFLGLISGVGWSEIANGVKALHPITNQLTSSSLRSWNFGTLEQRLDLGVYLKLATTPLLLILGASMLLIIPALYLTRRSLEWKGLLSMSVVALTNIFLFINLYFVHEYYFMAIYPVLATLAGWTVSRAALFLQGDRRIVAALTIVTLSSTWFGPAGPRAQWDAFALPKQTKEVSAVRDNTDPASRILALGCDWDPTLFYHAERTGLMIPGWYKYNDELWKFEDLSSYTHLATCGEAKASDIEALSGLRLREMSPGFLYSILK